MSSTALAAQFASCTGAGGYAICVRTVSSRRCAAVFRASGWLCGWVVQYALTDDRKSMAEDGKSHSVLVRFSRVNNVSLRCVTFLSLLYSVMRQETSVLRFLSIRPVLGQSLPRSLCPGRILTGSVSLWLQRPHERKVAHALEPRSNERSTPSLIPKRTVFHTVLQKHTWYCQWDVLTMLDSASACFIWTPFWKRSECEKMLAPYGNLHEANYMWCCWLWPHLIQCLIHMKKH